MKKYYIEFSLKNESNNYIMQSEWFDTKDEALKFSAQIDFIDSKKIIVSLMSSEWNEEEDTYNDIIMEEKLYD